MDAFTVSETNMLGADDDDRQINNPQPNSLPEPDNKFQKAIAAWRGVDFSNLIPQLDSTASEIVGHQKDALVERKELAQKTKDFRKLDDPSKLTEIKSLLKSYQTFIDLLTNHGKTSSSAFLQIYTSLSDVPDPFPLLEASVESLVISEDTLPKLTSENEELQRRVNKLSTQLEDTEKKLQEETKARKEAEAGSGARIQEIEANWAKALEEKQSNWEAKEQAFEEKIENQDRLFKELKASYEVTQRLGQTDEGANGGALGRVASAEFDMVSAELDKTNARLAEIQARNEQLRIDLARITSQSTSSSVDEDTLLRLQSENSSLLRKVDSVRFEREAEKREWDNKVRHAERQRSQLSADVQDLKTKIQKWSDYDEIKRELDMLRSIELSADDEDEIGEHAVNGSAQPGKSQSLEQLLLGRNKKLSNDMTLLRVAHRDIQQRFDDLQEELSNTNAELERSQKLAATLENDLLKIQDEASNALPSSAMSVAGTYTSRHPGSRRGRSSPTSSIISGYDSQRPGGMTTLESLRSGEPVGGGSGILPMIQAQRDRFKQKNQQLEEELSKTYATVTSLRQEVASLQKDNLNLYEKSRYVSTYNRGANVSSSSAYSGGPSHTSVFAGEDGSSSTDNRWKSQYEANISPFAAFRGREATRAYKRMSLPERIIFSLTRIVLATRTSRNLFATYCVALHVLVFVMLYWTGTTEAERHSAHLSQAAAAVVGGTNLKSSEKEWHQEGFG